MAASSVREILQHSSPSVSDNTFAPKYITQVEQPLKFADPPCQEWDDLGLASIETWFGNDILDKELHVDLQASLASVVKDEEYYIAHQRQLLEPTLNFAKIEQGLHTQRQLHFHTITFQSQQYHVIECIPTTKHEDNNSRRTDPVNLVAELCWPDTDLKRFRASHDKSSGTYIVLEHFVAFCEQLVLKYRYISTEKRNFLYWPTQENGT